MMKSNMRYRLPLLLFLWLSLTVRLQAQDFRIAKFQQNLLDLTASRSAVVDKNGDACALIKFTARDQRFTFEPNMGVVKQVQQVGETWLYVPQHTKRITIRHPQLGVLHDYVIPVSIEQKAVYEAEIEITSEDYLRSLLQTAKTDTVRIMVPQEPTAIHTGRERGVFFNLGLGFNAVGLMGPAAYLGFNFRRHVVEGGVVYGIGKAKNISVFQKDNGAFWGTYDYKAMRLFVRYGYDIELSDMLITPLAGAAVNNISSTEVKRSSSGDLFSKLNTVSATVGCRLSYCIGKTIRLQLLPEYTFGVKKDGSFDVLKDVDSKIKSWSDGLSVTAGIAFHF